MIHFFVEKNEALYDAIRNEDTETVQRMLDDPKVDVNCSHYALTPFLSACNLQHVPIIKLFLESKRDIGYKAVYREKCGALFLAFGNPMAVKLLLDDPRIDACRGYLGNTRTTLLHSRYVYVPGIEVFMAHDRFDPSILSMKNSAGATPCDFAKHIDPRMAKLYRDYSDDPVGTKAKLRAELGYSPYDAGELFAIVVLLCDNYLELK